MISVSNSDLSTLRAATVCANTPTYLFRRFRESPAVHALSRKHSAEELAESLNELRNRRSAEDDNLILVYCCIVALGIKGDEGMRQLEQVEPIDIGWAEYLRAAARTSYVPATQVRRTLSLKPQSQMLRTSASQQKQSDVSSIVTSQKIQVQ